MRCPSCGTENPEGNQFCKNCGSRLGAATGAPTPATTSGKTSMGMEQNTAAGLSYVLGWLTGIIFFFSEKDNKFVRFHAMQSIIVFGALTVIQILWSGIIGAIIWNVSWGLWGVISAISWIIWLAGAILWILLLVQAFKGVWFKLPWAGEMAERYANK